MRSYSAFLLYFAACVSTVSGAEPRQAPAGFPPDERYKADLLLIVAHPDDDVVIGGYLAKISLDDRKRVAVVYCTSGDGGGNAVGNEAGAALGQLRPIEARRALHFLGIDNVWFLGAHDTPGQDPLRSLDNWKHGLILDEVVRLVRITRPEVMMTWMPNAVVGENHGDHQASGVIATEAFDSAGDPTQFPEQVSAPHNAAGMANLTEGLHPWQPKKLYYFTDAFEDFGPYWHDPADLSPFRENFLDGRGPQYAMTEVSPSRHETYAKLTAEEQVFYLTQEGYLGQEALGGAGLKGFEYPVRLLFGKSVMGGSKVTDDVFAHLTAEPAPFVRVTGFQTHAGHGLSIELGGPWMFYREFWKAHDLTSIAGLIPVPELAVKYHETLPVPLLLRNDSTSAETVELTAALPPGWSNQTPFVSYSLRPGETYAVPGALLAPPAGEVKWEQIVWTATSRGRTVGTVTIRVLTGKTGGLPQ